MRLSNIRTARYLAEILENKKARDVVILNVRRWTMAAEYFVIATADSSPHRRTLIDELKKCGKIHSSIGERISVGVGGGNEKNPVGLRPLRVEGNAESRWVVADYGGVMVHIMSKDERRTVALENLYDGARRVGRFSQGSHNNKCKKPKALRRKNIR